MTQPKSLHSIKNKLIKQIQHESQKVTVKNVVDWSAIARVFFIFIISFFICFFSVRYLLSFVLSSQKRQNTRQLVRVTVNFQNSFSQTIKKLSSLLPQKKYDYYQTKRQFVDPVLMKEILDNKDENVLIVDIRSIEEYKNAHIKKAINAPAYSDSRNVYGSLTSKGDMKREIGKYSGGKKLIIIYGYSPTADIIQDVYGDLSQIVPVRILGVSWNEWRNNFYSWLPAAETQAFSISKYIEGNTVTNSPGLPQL